jgi:hypothetical protein
MRFIKIDSRSLPRSHRRIDIKKSPLTQGDLNPEYPELANPEQFQTPEPVEPERSFITVEADPMELELIFGPQAPTPPAGQREKNPHAVALGHRGGIKGGPARAKLLTVEQRRDIARKGARARWGKPKN